MNMKAKPKINDFIHDLLFMDEDKGEIVISLRKLVFFWGGYRCKRRNKIWRFGIYNKRWTILWNLCPKKIYISRVC
jgi:hypothetical protein